MRHLILSASLFLFITSCTTRAVEPTRQSRHTIDTLYQQKIVSLQPEMDAACAAMYDSIFKVAVDSIVVSRKIEMDSLVK